MLIYLRYKEKNKRNILKMKVSRLKLNIVLVLSKSNAL